MDLTIVKSETDLMTARDPITQNKDGDDIGCNRLVPIGGSSQAMERIVPVSSSSQMTSLGPTDFSVKVKDEFIYEEPSEGKTVSSYFQNPFEDSSSVVDGSTFSKNNVMNLENDKVVLDLDAVSKDTVEQRKVSLVEVVNDEMVPNSKILDLGNCKESDETCQSRSDSSVADVSYDPISFSQGRRDPEAVFAVKTLMKCRNFSSSVGELSRYGILTELSIKSLAQKHPQTFWLKKDVIKLKPQLRVCRGHCSPQGCQDLEICSDLHICNEYIINQCQNSKCVLGHRWDTGHNFSILEKLLIDILPPSILQNLLKLNGGFLMQAPILEICLNYNKDGCFSSICPFLHICIDFMHGLVSGERECVDNCERNHDVMSSACQPLLLKHGIPINETPKDIVHAIVSANPLILRKEVRGIKRSCSSQSDAVDKSTPVTVWSHYLNGDVAINEICYHSVEGMCPQEETGCQRLHCTTHFHWQVSEQEKHWLNLRPSQAKCLERAYCDPGRDSAVLPLLDPASMEHTLNNLFAMMGRDTWSSDFYRMTLINSSSTKELKIRRLCTEKLLNVKVRPSTFVWYFLDQNNKWVEYGKVESRGNPSLKSNISSADIEEAYLADRNASIQFSNSLFNYVLNFQQMMQLNLSTKKFRQVMRRPESHLQEDDMEDLPEIWRKMIPTERMQRVTLSKTSAEYRNAFSLLNKTQFFMQNWLSIERIQNPYLWRAFQNKIKEMGNIYGNLSNVNVQYLFHGTTSDCVENICEQNFDWRLHGNKNGYAFGQGTYFSTNAQEAARYTRPDVVGHHFMFIAQVAVGTTVMGNPQMKRPPINPVTNFPYDSTVNSINPTIIVKYDKQEYYPEYLVTFYL